jgi:hypothetical protein
MGAIYATPEAEAGKRGLKDESKSESNRTYHWRPKDEQKAYWGNPFWKLVMSILLKA